MGLDPHLDRLPSTLSRDAAGVRAFCEGVVDAVAGVAAAVKPQVAFFEQLGSAGVRALEHAVAYARDAGLLVVLDAKRGDIGSTARAYAHATLDDDGPLGADAVTLSPYLGPESLDPFLAFTDRGKGMFVLVRTSNPGAGPWQREPAERIARWIAAQNASRCGASGFGPVGAVIGATLGDVSAWRELMPQAWFLAPGYGAQGATAADFRTHLTAAGTGALVIAARAVLFPSAGVDGADWQARVAARAAGFAAEFSGVLTSRTPT